MRRERLIVLGGGCAAVIAAAIGGVAAAPPAAPTGGGGLQILEFKPGLDDLMNMMVQPRHIKLYIAVRNRNWELAAFQSDELRASFRRIGQTIPRYRGEQVDDMVAALITPRLDEVDQAIKARDPAAFTRSYDGLTESCNACHQTLNHPFLVMKAPDAATAANYPDQDFRPRK